MFKGSECSSEFPWDIGPVENRRCRAYHGLAVQAAPNSGRDRDNKRR
jgi:hypothetical protein